MIWKASRESIAVPRDEGGFVYLRGSEQRFYAPRLGPQILPLARQLGGCRNESGTSYGKTLMCKSERSRYELVCMWLGRQLLRLLLGSVFTRK